MQQSQKSSEKKEEEAVLSITKIEIVRYFLFTLILLFIALQQMRISPRFASNQTVKSFFYQNDSQNILGGYVGRVESLQWINRNLYAAYNLNRQDLDPQSSQVFPLTKLRIRQDMIKIDQDTQIWNQDLTQQKDRQGIYYQYEADPITGIYNVSFYPWVVHISEENQRSGKVDDITFDNLNLIELGFLNQQTHNVLIDASYYVPNTGMIVSYFIYIFRQLYKYNVSILPKEWSLFSLQQLHFSQIVMNHTLIKLEQALKSYSWYLQNNIKIFYFQYVIVEFLKIKDQINKSIEEDQRIQDNLRRKPKKRSQESDSALKVQQTKSSQVFEEAEKLKKKIKLILKGFQNHVSDIWSALDVIQLILLGVGVSYWVQQSFTSQLVVILDEMFKNTDNYVGMFLGVNKQLSESLNEEIVSQATLRTAYRRLLSVNVLFACVKFNKYVIYLIPSLQRYMHVILNVVNYLLSFFIIIFVLLISFTEVLYFKFSSQITLQSTFYNCMIYMFGMLMTMNDAIQDMFDLDMNVTFIISILFYLLMTCILLGLFFVFVVYEYNDYQNKIQKSKGGVDPTLVDRDLEKAVKYQHPIWYLYDLMEQLFLQFYFTLTLRRGKLNHLIKSRENHVRILEREFLINPHVLDFGVDFQDVIEGKVNASLQEKKQSEKDDGKFLMEDEREKLNNRSKLELVKLIWRTFILLILLTSNFILVQEFYSPDQAFIQSKSLQQKLLYGGQTDGQSMLFSQISNLEDVQYWIQNVFPKLFDQIILGKRELQSIYKQPDPWVNDTTLREDEQVYKYLYDEFGFKNLSRGNSLNFFNLLVNNVVRLSIRKSKVTPNPNPYFAKLKSYIKQLFLPTPRASAEQSLEQMEPYYYPNAGQSIFGVDYRPDGGWQSCGGYDLILELEQVSNTVQQLQDYGFLNETLASITIDFVTFNPINKRGLAYVVIYFVPNEGGLIDNSGIDITAIKKNSLQTVQEISVLLLSLTLFFSLCYYLYKSIHLIFMRNMAYTRWYSTFILQMLNRSQLYFRERHNPEIIRKWMFLLDLSQILNFCFLILMGCQITFIILSFFSTNSLISACSIFGVPISEMLQSVFVALDTPSSVHGFFNYTQKLILYGQLISAFASMAIMVLCVEILYLLANNRSFQNLTKSLADALSHLINMVIILFLVVMSFSLMSFILMGSNNRKFSTFFGTVISVITMIQNLPEMTQFRGVGAAVEFFCFLLPYIFCARFILVNMFYALTYRAYNVRKKLSEQGQSLIDSSASITFTEFVNLSILLFKMKEGLPKPQSDLYLIQIIKLFDPKKVYSQIKENIRNQINMCNIKTWSEKCASDIKEEAEMRQPLDVASQEILQAYIQLNNQGDFEILQKLNKQPDRQLIEYGLKVIYVGYFQQYLSQVEKLISFFNHRIDYIKTKLFSHIQATHEQRLMVDNQSQEQYQLVLVNQYENTLEENLLYIQFIREELSNYGIDEVNVSATKKPTNIANKSAIPKSATQLKPESPKKRTKNAFLQRVMMMKALGKSSNDMLQLKQSPPSVRFNQLEDQISQPSDDKDE